MSQCLTNNKCSVTVNFNQLYKVIVKLISSQCVGQKMFSLIGDLFVHFIIGPSFICIVILILERIQDKMGKTEFDFEHGVHVLK